MIRLSLALGVLGIITACASGDQNTGGSSMSEAEAIALYNASVKWEDQIVCEKQRVTGTSIRKKVCLTRSQIEDQLNNSRDAMDIINREHGYKRY